MSTDISHQTDSLSTAVAAAVRETDAVREAHVDLDDEYLCLAFPERPSTDAVTDLRSTFAVSGIRADTGRSCRVDFGGTLRRKPARLSTGENADERAWTVEVPLADCPP